MANGRFVSKSVAEDKRLNELSVEAQLVYMMAIPHLDRDGLIAGDVPVLFGKVCPRRLEFAGLMPELIRQWVEAGLVVSYETDNGNVLWFAGFAKNQQGLRYDREAPSQYPPPPGYERDVNAGLTPVVSDELRTYSGPTPEKRLQEQVEVKAEVKEEEEVQEKRATPARKIVHVKSPHFTAADFDGEYVPNGKGKNAVQVYYERFSIRLDPARLNAIQEDDLIRECTNLDRLRRVVTAYSQTNYRPGNLKLILDWYRGGIPDRNGSVNEMPTRHQQIETDQGKIQSSTINWAEITKPYVPEVPREANF